LDPLGQNSKTLMFTRKSIAINMHTRVLSHSLFSEHARTVVRFKGDKASQWKRPKFVPSPRQNPFNRSSPKLADVITSWMANGMKNFVSIGSGVSTTQVCDFAVSVDVTSFTFVFWWFFNKATAYTFKQIFTQNTSHDVVPGKEVPFGVTMTIFNI